MEFWKLDKYLRHQSIHWINQEELFKKRVLIVGVGAIGNELLKNLLLMGVGNIFLVDRETIEIHNLTRSILFSEKDVGKSKVEVAKKKAEDINPDAKVEIFHGNIMDIANSSFIKNFDGVFSSVDNFEARIFLHKMCFLEKVDFFNAGIDSQYASLEYYPYSRSRKVCYECYLPTGIYEKIRERYSCGWIQRRAYLEKKIPTTIITASFAGAGLLSLFLRRENFEVPIKITIDTIRWNLSPVEFHDQKECFFCTDYRDVEEIYWNEFIKNYKELYKEELTLFLNEPIISYLECNECGYKKDIWDLSRNYDDSILDCPVCGKKEGIKAYVSDIFTTKDIIHLDRIHFKFAFTSLENKNIVIKK